MTRERERERESKRREKKEGQRAKKKKSDIFVLLRIAEVISCYSSEKKKKEKRA